MANEVCSKCGSGLDTKGYPHWCRACRAKYKREYEDVRASMLEAQAFSRGAEAMQRLIAERLRKASPGGLMMVGEVVAWVSRLERPAYAPNITETESVPAAP